MKRPALVMLAEMAAIAAAAATIAFWGWRLAEPGADPVAVTPPPEPSAQAIAGASIFGRGGAASTPAPAAQVPPMRLHGVVIEGDRRARALLAVSGMAAWYRAGDEVSPGVRLDRIERDRVHLDSASGPAELTLIEPRASGDAGVGGAGAGSPPGARATAQPAATPASRVARRPGCPVDAAALRGAYFLRGELLENVARQPQTWRALFVPDAGALLVQGEDAAVTLLGLQAGDRLERANGAALAVVEDMRRLVLEPLVANHAVRVTGTRQGAAAQWLYVNATACPPG